MIMVFERISEAFRFWSSNLAAIMLVTLPFALTGAALEIATGANELDLEKFQLTTGLAVYALSAVVLAAFAEAALVAQLAAIQQGKARSLLDCLLFALAKGPGILAIYLLLGVAVIPLVTLLGVPLIGMAAFAALVWLYVRLSLAAFILALENQSPLRALRHSFIRTDAMQWPMLGAWLLTGLIVMSTLALGGALLVELLGQGAGTSVLVKAAVSVFGASLNVLLFRFYGLSRPQTDPAD